LKPTVSGANLVVVKRSLLLFCAIALAGAPARADETTGDRTAIRFIAPETGGPSRPRYISDRELGFFARIEAMNENVTVNGEYPERYVRAATDRLVARAMLASLMIQRGSEPPDLPKLAQDARAELADRIGGPPALEAAMKKEGIEEDELLAFLRDQVRAAFYIDRGITPILTITEDSLREAFRAAIHPYRNMKFEDARVRLRRWVIAERQRSAELEFLQGARARIKIAIVDPAGVAK
jgi:hypothetical protein